MPNPLRGLLSFLNKPQQNKTAIEELTDHLLQDLRRDRRFVRNLREAAFGVCQRRCELVLWNTLLTFAAERLNARNAAEFSKAPAQPRKCFLDYKYDELSEVMARIDPGLISNAVCLVTDPQAKRIASLSLPGLIAILVDLEKHWTDLGQLPSFKELRDECYMVAIGYAQSEFCRKNRLPLPSANRPTLGELQLLDQHFSQQFSAQSQPPLLSSVWKTWGVGWLVARALLGMSHDVRLPP